MQNRKNIGLFEILLIALTIIGLYSAIQTIMSSKNAASLLVNAVTKTDINEK